MSASAPHTAKGYDDELRRARALALQMGARVVGQTLAAVECLGPGMDLLVDRVLRDEALVNAQERTLDELAGQIIARRQPAANDLRLLMVVLKVTTDLERIGDEAKKIALQARRIHADTAPRVSRDLGLRRMAEAATAMLRGALGALERLEVDGLDGVIGRDAEINEAFRGVLRQLISFMIEDPRTISCCLDLLFVAKALERIGDHAKNIAEHVIYAVKGADVRHAAAARIEREVRG